MRELSKTLLEESIRSKQHRLITCRVKLFLLQLVHDFVGSPAFSLDWWVCIWEWFLGNFEVFKYYTFQWCWSLEMLNHFFLHRFLLFFNPYRTRSSDNCCFCTLCDCVRKDVLGRPYSRTISWSRSNRPMMTGHTSNLALSDRSFKL